MNMAHTPRPRSRPGTRAAGNPHFALFALLAALLAACSRSPSPPLQGYLEGEFVYLAAPLAGQLTRLAVARGEDVPRGALLFTLDDQPESAAFAETEHRLAQARARHDNLLKGRRPSEIASLEAQLSRAEADLRLAEAEGARREQLSQDHVISASELDASRNRLAAGRALVASLQADLETARLGARADEIRAAEAETAAAEAACARTRWAVSQKRVEAPSAARVHDTLFRAGEFVAAGQPVVVLLPPENLKVRFFAPQDNLSSLQPGREVQVHLDGFASPIPATISYVASQAEFTPPVIYSKENRAKLVFMVEARFAPEIAPRLHPGQPADVSLAPGP